MDHKKLIEYLLLASITGSGGLIVTHIAKMSESLQLIRLSVQELNARIEVLTTRMVTADEVLKDHESRLRSVERVKLK